MCLVVIVIAHEKSREHERKLTWYVAFVGLTWVAPSLDGCVAGSVGWFGDEEAEEPEATVDGGFVLVPPLLPLINCATLEPGVCGV